jgi:hypothetical protein
MRFYCRFPSFKLKQRNKYTKKKINNKKGKKKEGKGLWEKEKIQDEKL